MDESKICFFITSLCRYLAPAADNCKCHASAKACFTPWHLHSFFSIRCSLSARQFRLSKAWPGSNSVDWSHSYFQQAFSLWCGDGRPLGAACHFSRETSHGNPILSPLVTLNMTSGLVVDSSGHSLKGLSGVKTEDERCHLRLEEASEDDLGSWTCILGLDERTGKFRWAGTQSLLTGEQVN